MARTDYLEKSKQKRRRNIEIQDLKRFGREDPALTSRRAMIREKYTPGLYPQGPKTENQYMQRYANPAQMTDYTANLGAQATNRAETILQRGRPGREIRTSDLEHATGEQSLEVAKTTEARTGLEHEQTMKKGQQELEMMRLEQEKAALLQPTEVGLAQEDLRQKQALAPHEELAAKTRAENVLPMAVAQGEGPVGDMGRLSLLDKSGAGGGIAGMQIRNQQATQEAGIIGAQSGLDAILAQKTETSAGGMLAQIADGATGDPWTEESLFTLQNIFSSIQTALNSNLSPEARQIILNGIRNHPGYATIFAWQDAGGMWGSEQARGGPYDQIFHQGGYNQAGELAQQIVQLVESNGVSTGNILPQ